MNIDIQALVNAKLKEMEEGKVLENLISQTVEKAVTKAVTDAIDGYSIKNIIEKKIEKDVKAGVESVGFCAYNTIVADQIQNLLHSVVKEDIATKLNKLFNDVMINKKETIKLSEIVDEYRRLYDGWDCEALAQLDNGYFHVVWDEEETDYGSKHMTIIFSQKEQKENRTIFSNYYTGDKKNKLELTLSIWKDEEKARIICVRFEDAKLDDLKSLRDMSDFEAFLANLYLNETKVEIDLETEEDIDTYVGGGYWD